MAVTINHQRPKGPVVLDKETCASKNLDEKKGTIYQKSTNDNEGDDALESDAKYKLPSTFSSPNWKKVSERDDLEFTFVNAQR